MRQLTGVYYLSWQFIQPIKKILILPRYMLLGEHCSHQPAGPHACFVAIAEIGNCIWRSFTLPPFDLLGILKGNQGVPVIETTSNLPIESIEGSCGALQTKGERPINGTYLVLEKL
ncbi:hypothetical protein PHYBLDRAFT_151826 [Phycomyces blakesleeanus NRRL 1555(-)]|uniref:Uncharacterized protein n=1 Tax=Phycomyces blakesleeanus (strain ATCC 8743b / DSM 1359 / FGSC 10004 / NBRC 33097 / NRRL 1555) TaxID=763407 RepID=A0A167K3V0_PHYB8|nr:hypothetical protein PHYBLDRAFT_151826 [Phycomyces blakesleeanus NRRL 1555(-)]OAD67219.1 hypothetical protein PHYBLDRAFT_151826 [Phycomyces blakesleeanus NRRL 1555(-)]|eukprot:XP_018285259.1 hypothetical protein PHYBLDRAFT_151826 [Phycomyces blakesleeanus NRRL 1555(-)]